VIGDLVMKTSGGAEVKTHTCLTWAAGEVADQMTLSATFRNGKDSPKPSVQEAGGPRPDLKAVQKR
jgi:hypothetical protein